MEIYSCHYLVVSKYTKTGLFLGIFLLLVPLYCCQSISRCFYSLYFTWLRHCCLFFGRLCVDSIETEHPCMTEAANSIGFSVQAVFWLVKSALHTNNKTNIYTHFLLQLKLCKHIDQNKYYILHKICARIDHKS